MDSLHNRVSKMSFGEMLADAWNTSRERYSRDPMESLSPSMKASITPNSLRCMSMAGVTYFLSVLFLILVTSFGWTLPVVYASDPDLHSRRLYMALYVLFNTLANFILTITKPGYYNGNKTASVLGILPDPHWRKCLDCDHLSPPRTHHCPLCRRCVLKRDHHCFFTATCVGHENQRYFIVYCFYCALGTAYAFYVTFQYVYIVYPAPDVSWYDLLLPVTACEWILGYCSTGFIYFVTLMYLCMCTGIGSAGIFIWQFFLAAWGTTTHEFWKSNNSFRSSIPRHLRSVFGPFWMLNFIVPLPFLKQPGNGVEWTESKLM